MRLSRAAATLAVAGVLAGCAGPTAPAPAGPTSSSPADRVTLCAEAAQGIVQAAAQVVAGYEQPETGSAGVSEPTPEPGPAPAEDPLTAAVDGARKAREAHDCDPQRFAADLEAGLADIHAEGPIAQAVQRRVSASLLGTLHHDEAERQVAAGEDLRTVTAEAADGATLVLPAGTWELDTTLVLLAGVTLRGAGADATIIRSRASDAAVLVATPSLVRFEGISLELTPDVPASGLVAGPSASVALSGVRVSGAASDAEGAGGAGVFLSAHGVEASGRGTTLEITQSAFESNAWVGVAVAGGHRVSVEASTFVGNGDAGVLFLDASSGSIDGSTLRDNAVGVAATGTATPTLLASTVEGGSVGVQLDGSAAPTIDGLRITGASSAAVIFGGESAGSIRATTCEDVPHGIVVSDAAAPTLQENGCGVARGSGG